jgi:O-antigen/teichoic acid export membrane protein
VRLWLKDSERRPDPAPVKTDDRKAVLVGLVLWIAALAVALIFIAPITADGNGWWLWTIVAGLVLGLVLLLYTHWRHPKS